MIGLITILLLLALISWLLFAPILLKIDTRHGHYIFHWKGIASARLVLISDELLVRLRIFFWKIDYNPLQWRSKKKQKKEKTPQKKKSPGRGSRRWLRRGMRLIRSFEIKIFRLHLDTDDYIQNSYLYPLFYFLNKGKRQFKINYEGEPEMLLIVENRLYRMLLALI